MARKQKLHWSDILGKCPIRCPCLCHDTQGGVHNHPGEPCPGKLER